MVGRNSKCIVMSMMENMESGVLTVVASGVTDPTQQQALLLHCASLAVRDIFKTFTNKDKGGAKDYNKAIDCLSDNCKVTKMSPWLDKEF